jgi:hypothetical protein
VFWATALAQAGECHIFHAYEVPYVERMRLCGVDQAELASHTPVDVLVVPWGRRDNNTVRPLVSLLERGSPPRD